MSVGVFTRMKRFTFVEKTLAEVGDGTAWPMLVTPDQLAEIYYRVKNSKLTGAVTETYDGIVSILGISGDPISQFVESTSVTVDNFDPPPDTIDITFQSARSYSTITVTGFSVLFGSVYSVAMPYGGTVEVYDVGNNEIAMWIPETSVVGFNGPGYCTTGFSNSFSTDAEGYQFDSLPSSYLAYHSLDGFLFGARAFLEFNGQVAWIDDSGSGNPLDPANRLFIGMLFEFSSAAYGSSSLATLNFTGVAIPTSSLFEIELSGATVLSCPLFAADIGATYSGNIRAIATEWWPYAKDSPPAPVWDTSTGAKL